MRNLPSRRDTLRVGASALLSAPWVSRLSRSKKERPNLVLLCSDQQHWRALGHADPFFSTPRIDALAAEGRPFSQAYCTSPQCSPSRSSMMTGFYPHKTGVLTNWSGSGADLRLPTFGGPLREAGYHTVYLGKWHLSQAPESDAWNEQRKIIGDKRVTEDALEFLSRADKLDRPFVLVLMFLEPHNIVRFEPEAKGAQELEGVPLGESFDHAGEGHKLQDYFMDNYGGPLRGQSKAAFQQYRLEYRRRVRELDSRVEEVLSALDSNGLTDRTAVLLTSDHGEMDTHHGLVYKGPFMYDQLVRVPMIAYLPEAFGGTAGPLDHYAWVNVDLAPTLLELAGGEPQPSDGISAVPLLRGEPQESRPFVIGQFHSKKSWVCPVRMLRTEKLKYNLYIDHGEELFDLERDPWETTNLAEQPDLATKKKELRNELEAWIAANEDPFHSFEASPLRSKPFRRRK